MELNIRDEYFDYKKVCAVLSRLHNLYKAQIGTVAKSCSGRGIPYIKIGKAENSVLFAGAFHGSEHITAALLLKFAAQLCYAFYNHTLIEDIYISKAMKERSVIIIPMVNPDGCEIAIHGKTAATGCLKYAASLMREDDYAHYNANGRGVDINHNFPAGWELVHSFERKAGIFGPSPSRYGGSRPASEPETCGLIKFCRDRYITHALAFHSQGEVIYWNYDSYSPKKAESMARVMAAISGYALDVPIGTAVGAGFKDWFIKEFDRPAFTVEVGKGKNPLPMTEAENIYRDLREMMVVSAIM